MASTKLIFACDVSDFHLGLHLIRQVADEVEAVKVGLEAMTAENETGHTLAHGFRDEAHRFKKSVMWDMKLHDIGNTTEKAARNIVTRGSRFLTLHAFASDNALEAAVRVTAGTGCTALAVTLLTDLDDARCISRFGVYPHTAVKAAARISYENGIRGFVCSPEEIKIIRDSFSDVTIVTPGVRPLWYTTEDEQQRITTPAEAARAGADYVVVGRPIYTPPSDKTPRDAARLIREELEAA